MFDANSSETVRDFNAVLEAVTATSQGRWFLDEYARRNRHADTTEILSAIKRLAPNENQTPANEHTPKISPHIAEELADTLELLVRLRHLSIESQTNSARGEISLFVDEMEHHLLRIRDFLGITDNSNLPPDDEKTNDLLAKLPPELADEVALMDGFDDSTPTTRPLLESGPQSADKSSGTADIKSA